MLSLTGLEYIKVIETTEWIQMKLEAQWDAKHGRVQAILSCVWERDGIKVHVVRFDLIFDF